SPNAAASTSSPPSLELNDFTSSTYCWRSRTIFAPIVHQPATFLKQIAAPICSFDTVADGVSQREFHEVVRIVGALGRPIAEGGTKAMHGDVIASHTP